MMFEKRRYHYLVAGLPELKFEDSGFGTSLHEFKSKLKRELHSADYQQVEILLYPYDHSNLVRYFQGIDIKYEGLETYSTSDFRDQIELFTAIVPGEDILPPYMREVMRRHHNRVGEFDHLTCRKELDAGYYKHVENFGSRFVQEYILFEYNLSNMLAFLASIKQDVNPAPAVTGENSFARHLKQISGMALEKDPEFEYFEEIHSISKSSSFSSAELKYDQLRWQVINQLTLFEDFTNDALLCYLLKVMIAFRWTEMSKDKGREQLLKVANMVLKPAIPVEEES